MRISRQGNDCTDRSGLANWLSMPAATEHCPPTDRTVSLAKAANPGPEGDVADPSLDMTPSLVIKFC
jgi:hypothetical protein